MKKKIRKVAYLSATAMSLGIMGVASITPVKPLIAQSYVANDGNSLNYSLNEPTVSNSPLACNRAVPDKTAPVVRNFALPLDSELTRMTPGEMIVAFQTSPDSQPVQTLLQLLKQEFETRHSVKNVTFLNVKMALVPNSPSNLTLEYQLQWRWTSKDEDSFFEKPLQTIVSGFTIPRATIVQTDLRFEPSINMYAQEVANNTTYDHKLIEMIKNTVQHLPSIPGIDSNNLFEILNPTEKKFNNQDGTLKFTLRIHLYFDRSGNLHCDDQKIKDQIPDDYSVIFNQDEHLDFQITFRGFQKVPGPTSIRLDVNNEISSQIFNFANVDPWMVDDDVLKQVIYENMENLPLDATYQNIIFREFTPGVYKKYDAKNGKITLNVTYNHFFDSTYRLISKDSNVTPLPISVTITGFKIGTSTSTILPTAPIAVSNVGDFLPYQYDGTDEAIKNWIIYQTKAAIAENTQNLPEGFDTTENIQITNFLPNNKRGEITISGTINFFIKDGNLIHSTSGRTMAFENIVLTGFKNTLSTTMTASVPLPNLNSSLPENLTDKEILKKIIYQNASAIFNNLPAQFALENIILDDSVIKADNLTGNLRIENVKLNHYFDNDALSTYINTTKMHNFGTLTISNLKHTQPTTIKKNVMIPDTYKNNFASDIFNDESAIKQITQYLIFDAENKMFEFLPPDFKHANLVDARIAQKNSYDNQKGTISIIVTIDNYYDEDGFLRTTNREFETVLSGFKPINGVSIPPTNVKLPDIYHNLLPQNLANDELKEIVNSNIQLFFNPLPQDFQLQNVTKTAFDNKDGTVTVNIQAANYFDLIPNHSVISKPATFEVVISGFQSVQETQVVPAVHISPTSTAAQWTQEIPSDIIGDNPTNSSSLKKLIVELLNTEGLKLVDNTPPNFNINHIQYTVNSYDNKKGSIDLNLKVFYYYDQQGILINNPDNPKPLEGDVIISGFQNVGENGTVIKDSFSLGDVYKDTLPSLITEETLTSILWTFRNTFIENLPKQATVDDLSFNFKEAYADNLNGRITLPISLNKYYDKNTGELIVANVNGEPLRQTVSIIDFARVSGATTIQQSFDISGYYAEDSIPRPSEVGAADLINFLLSQENSISNKPQNFSASNIRISSINPNNLSGYLYANVELNKYYDAKGKLYDDYSNWLSFPVKFYGFKTQSPTTIKTMISLPEFNNRKASEFSAPEILSLIRQNYQNPQSPLIENVPEYFSLDNIVDFELVGSPNNKLGQVSGKLTIDKFFNQEGVLNKKNELLVVDVLLVGFEPVGQTYANNIITLNKFNDVLPTLVKDEDIKNEIFLNKNAIYTNLPNGVDKKQLDIDIIPNSRSNKLGTVEARLRLHKYFDDNGTLVDSNTKSLDSILTIKGFRKALPTTAVTQWNMIDFNQVLPTTVNPDDLQNYLWEHRFEILNSLPDAYIGDSNKNDFKVSIVSADNREGKLKINLSLSTYYDQSSNLVEHSSNVQKFPIVLSGFKAVLPTHINGNVTLNDLTLKIDGKDQEVSLNDLEGDNKNDLLKDLILKNQKYCFTNLVQDELRPEDISVAIASTENKNGIVKAWVNLYRYYDERGLEVNSTSHNYLRKLVTFKGFASLAPSEVASYVSILEIDDLESNKDNILNSVPSDYVGTADEIKKRLLNLLKLLEPEIFNTMPESFNGFDGSVVDYYAPAIENSFANVNGELRVNITYKNYYDENAVLQTTKTKTQSIVIGGFKKVVATTVSQSIFVDDAKYNDKLPQQVLNSDLMNFLTSGKENYKNFINFVPDGFAASDITRVNITGCDNQKGTVDAFVYLSRYYDNHGMQVVPASNTASASVVIGEAKAFPVTFVNFQKSIPTLVNYEEVGGKDFVIEVPIGDNTVTPESIQQMTPEKWKGLKDKLNTSIQNTIIDYQKDVQTTIEINDYITSSYNNQDGSIRVTATIRNFINNKYEIVKEQDITLKISGFAISNTFIYNSVNDTFKYTMYILGGIILVVILICIIGFVMTYRKKRGLK